MNTKALAFFLLIGPVNASEKLSLANLREKLVSPKAALHFLHSDTERWSKYLSHVRSGEVAWIETWKSLRKVSDSGATQELNLAFGYLLSEKPSLVFSEIEKGWNKEDAETVTISICSGLEEEFSDSSSSRENVKKETRDYLNIRLRAIDQLNGISQRGLRKACEDAILISLEKSAKDVQVCNNAAHSIAESAVVDIRSKIKKSKTPWQDLREVFDKHWRACELRYQDQAFVDTIVTLTTEHWESIRGLAALSANDPGFYRFALRALSSETMSVEQNERIKELASKMCPMGQEKMCKDILKALKNAVAG